MATANAGFSGRQHRDNAGQSAGSDVECSCKQEGLINNSGSRGWGRFSLLELDVMTNVQNMSRLHKAGLQTFLI